VCLASLRAQVTPPSFELLVGGNVTQEIVDVVHSHFPDALVCRTWRWLPSAARNPLVERARGELLLFLDDDVTAPSDLLRRLADTATQHPEASVFGGPNETPPASSRFQVVQGAVLSSVLGAGPVSRRYGARHPGPADERWFTLCNLAVRRRVMVPFASNLVCAEENALLYELRRRRERMRYEPTLRVFHVRRPDPRAFAAQMLKYGRGRGQLLARRPSSARAAYLAPTLFLLYLALTPAAIPLGSRVGDIAVWSAMAPLALYAVLMALTALRIGWTLRSLRAVPTAAVLIPVVHLCYGAGVLKGMLVRGPRRTRPPGPAEWHVPLAARIDSPGATAVEKA
jgi:hypothetical protein